KISFFFEVTNIHLIYYFKLCNMHKRILSFLSLLTMVLILGSCGAQKKSTVGGTETSQGPTASQWRAGVKGKWVLTSVERENIPSTYTIKNIFDEAPVDCFI